MMRGLVAKELHQHGWLLGFLFLVLLSGLTIIAGNQILRLMLGSGFGAVRLMLFTFVPLACLSLGHALIATEFRHKTQIFLEGLPLPRWRMIAVKFTLGLGLMMGSVIATLLVSWLPARGLEAMTPRFALALLLKSCSWVWLVYTFCFAHAFLGRYRVIFAVLLMAGVTWLSNANVPVGDFGPFALVDQRFAYERQILPWTDLFITVGLGCAFTIIGFALGLVRDATIASLLAEKMSSREKMFITFLIIAGFFVVGYVAERISTPPVNMPGSLESQRGRVRVSISAAANEPGKEEQARLERAAKDAAADLDSLCDYLRCPSFPPVFIVQRNDFGPAQFEKGDLKPEQGVMVRANVTDPNFDAGKFRPWLVREVLITRTFGLAERERNAWVLDALADWWPRREKALTPLKEQKERIQGALAIVPKNFSTKDLERWLSVRKDHENDAAAWAGTGLDILAQTRGEDARRRFLTAMFAGGYSKNARTWWRDFTNPPSARLKRETGMSMEDLVSQWRAALEEVQQP